MELLQSMQVFAKLAELGCFTKVAEAMQAGRPHVTRTIQNLEASLGVRLFQRTTRKVKLTARGFMSALKRFRQTLKKPHPCSTAVDRRCGADCALTFQPPLLSAVSWEA